MTKGPEGYVKDAVKKILNEHGAYQFWPVVTVYGKKTVDCLACYRGHFISIETKRPGGKPTTNQQTTLDAVEAAGGYAIVEDTIDASYTKNILDLIDESF